MRTGTWTAVIGIVLAAGIADAAELVYVGSGGGTIWGQREGGLSFGLDSDETPVENFLEEPYPSMHPFTEQSQATASGVYHDATLTVRHGFHVTTPEPDELTIQTFADVMCSASGTSFLYVARDSVFPWPPAHEPAYAAVGIFWPTGRLGIDYQIRPTGEEAIGDPVTVTAGIWHQVTTGDTGAVINTSVEYARIRLNGAPLIATTAALHSTGSAGSLIFDAQVGDVITYEADHYSNLYCSGLGVEDSVYLRARSELTATLAVYSEPPGGSIDGAIMPYGRDADGTWHFPCMTITDEGPPDLDPDGNPDGDPESPLGLMGRPIWIDPIPATGFDYEVTGLAVETVTVDLPGDSDGLLYVSIWNEGLQDYEPAEPWPWDLSMWESESELPCFDFMGYPGDVYRFRITGIDPPVDGDDPRAFPTGLTFVQPGVVTSITMTPIPEPAGLALLAVAGLAMLRKRR